VEDLASRSVSSGSLTDAVTRDGLPDEVIGNPIQDGYGRKITIPLFTMR
jgi:hypothetical protein